MGQEANCLCHYENLAFEVKAILESQELILRGSLKLRASISDLYEISSNNGDLIFKYKNEEYRLELGNKAQKWEDKLKATPKSLAQKLSIKPETKIFKLNDFDALEINAAIGSEFCIIPNAADVIFIQAIKLEDLQNLVAFYEKNQIKKQVWIIHPKGKNAEFKETQVREFMRASGFMDNKISGVNEIWSATRYAIVV